MAPFRSLRAEEAALLRAAAPLQASQTVVLDSTTRARPEAEARSVPPIPDLQDNSLAVPGLELLSVEWEESVPGERALHIRQLFPTGDTLELRYLGMLLGSAPDLEGQRGRGVPAPEQAADKPLSPQVLRASLPPGWNQVEMRWGRGWLVARGPVSETYLRNLVKTIR